MANFPVTTLLRTLLDWSHIQGSPEHTDAVIEALEDPGLRAVFAYGSHVERIASSMTELRASSLSRDAGFRI